MMQISSTSSGGPLLSPRTADYVATPIREGDNFDYCKWLEGVRGEQPDVGKNQAAFHFPDVIVSAGAENSMSNCGRGDARSSVGPAPIKPVPVAKTIFRSLAKMQSIQKFAFGDGLSTRRVGRISIKPLS
jgi:hypothetical protein